MTVHLTERFDLDLGGRYSHNKQSAKQVSDGILAGGFNEFPTIKSDENVFTFSVAPRFEVNDNTSIYARVAKGFRPGGPNVVPPGAPAEVQTYDSDSLISYEVGIKAQTADGRFSIDAALFHIDWKDIQLIATVNGLQHQYQWQRGQERRRRNYCNGTPDPRSHSIPQRGLHQRAPDRRPAAHHHSYGGNRFGIRWRPASVHAKIQRWPQRRLQLAAERHYWRNSWSFAAARVEPDRWL